MHQLLRNLFLFVLLTSTGFQSSAGDIRQYDIEIVVFQNLVRNDHGEVWPLDYLTEGGQVQPRLEDQPDVVWLSGDQLQLAAHNQALKASSGYRPLAYYAWRQPVLDRNIARMMELPATGTESTAPYVDGSVRVSIARYLHLELDLQLHMQSRQMEFSPGDVDSLQIRLTEQRRMRSREIHYFDNPRFGAIALITPVE